MKPHSLPHSLAQCSRLHPLPTLPPQPAHWLRTPPACGDGEAFETWDLTDPDVETAQQNLSDEGHGHHLQDSCRL
ncbi:hypothetical protein SAMN02745166_02282 [Prosthecobacter debontii]|uniref:Uncharacterized protein n=1 Tax=Prosthecobacter debontii TaxID=48467 RepID=A0A1T4Y006_9BACT|nr:hypothetical protein [Prosthecobacter debontii]SKA95129.1 hypothetical protein SAMN02745166_02282 [Prosthecobacter debontii]